MFGPRIVRAFEEVKDTFDPTGLFNPGKIVRPLEDGRPQPLPLQARLPPAAARRRARLVGMGRLRQRRRDVQQQRRLPQIRPRRDVPLLSRHRRRAAPDARPRQHAAPRACRASSGRTRSSSRGHARDDGAVHLVQGLQARMPDRRRHGAHEDRVPASLPASATGLPRATGWSPICRAMRAYAARFGAAPQPAQPGAGFGRARASGCFGLSARAASCRNGRPNPYRGRTDTGAVGGRNVVLLVDTFNRYFEPENACAAERVLARAGYRVDDARAGGGRPLCCGRTFLAAGLVDEARHEARRMIDALGPAYRRGDPDHRARTVLPPDPARRVSGDPAGRRQRRRSPRTPSSSRNSSPAEQRPAASRCRSRPMPGRDRAAARPLPSEGLRHRRRRRQGLAADPRNSRSRPSTSTCCGMAGAFGYRGRAFRDVA